MPKTIDPEIVDDLQNITDLLSELSLSNTEEDVATLVCERGRSLIGADGVTFIKLLGNEAHYIEESSIEHIFKGEIIPLEQCVCGWSLSQNAPAFVADVIEDDRTNPDRYKHNFVVSLAMIPIRNPEPIGAIGFYYASEHSFPEREMKLMQCLSSAAEFSLRNIHLLSEVEQIVSERTKTIQNVNSELETFAYTVSHDLKNPLAVVKANCWTILELLKNEIPEKAKICAERIDDAAERMKGQIEGMLSMYRLTKDDIQPTDVDLSKMARQVINELKEIDPDRAVEIKISETPLVYGDRRMFGTLIENLVLNAWKYSVDANPSRIEFFAEENHEHGTVYCVRDNGMGFSDKDAESLFNVFQRLPQNSDIEGHGIGLASVQRIISKHGGHVWAEGVQEKGASFYFTLPSLAMDSDLETFIEELD